MRARSTFVLVVCAVLVAAAWVAATQETKRVRGTVTAVANDSLTVTVLGEKMSFGVTEDTRVIARGAGTAEREAQAAGKGLVLTAVVKSGELVEVEYHEAGGKLHAREIRGAVSGAEARLSDEPREPRLTTRGSVTAVSATSLTIKTSSGDMTFAATKETSIVGEGLGTKTRELKAAGKTPALNDLLKLDDFVEVSYRKGDAGMTATEVRVTRKAPSI